MSPIMETLPGYTFEQYLGHGQTKTWKAKREGREVVVKTLELERVGDWKGIELFEREVATLKQLNHDSIPSFVDFKKDNNDGAARWHLVQEFVQGHKPTVAFAGANLTENNLRSFSIHVLNALAYLQAFSPPLLHRDIKPDNLLVHNKGVSIVDFGSVRYVVPSRTGGSTVAGTSGYMAPEQLMGRADKSSDLYGLGMTLVRLITGHEPDDLPKNRMKIDWRSHAKVRLSEPFAKFVDTLCEPHPEQRFTSAADALARMDDTGPPPSLVPEVTTTLNLVQEPDGALHARSWGLTASWTAPITVALLTIFAVLLAPVVFFLSPFIFWWFAVNATNTRFRFADGNVDVERGWLFKKQARFPAHAFIGLEDKERSRSSFYLNDTKVTGQLTFRERAYLLRALEYKAVSHIDEAVQEEAVFDFEEPLKTELEVAAEAAVAAEVSHGT